MIQLKTVPPKDPINFEKPEMIIHIADIDKNGKVKPNNSNDPLTNILGPLLFGNAFNPKTKNRHKNNTETQIESDDEVEDPIEYNSDDIFEELEVEANTIKDLIKLGDLYEAIIKESNDAKTKNSSGDVNEKKDDDTDTDSEHDKPTSKPSMSNINGNNSKKPEQPKTQDRKKPDERPKTDDSKNKHRSELIDKMLKSKKIIKGPLSATSGRLGGKKPASSPKRNNSICEINGKRYSINIEVLSKLRKPLNKLQSLIGLESLKESIVDMILYYVQGFENRTNNMLHTIIEGPPGVGKTEVGKILAEIYAGLGIIPSSKFKMVKRVDLVGEYLGHTAIKTQQVIDDADGGVLFIDEAYSLGNDEKRDSFAKECIDTITQNLSEKKRNLIVIIAGYPDQLEKCFFSYNPGLKRRFPFKHTIDGYQSDELRDIFIKKIKDSKWKLNEDELDIETLSKFFKDNKDDFPNYGGDIDNLWVNCKYMHSRRVVGKHPTVRFKLVEADIKNGMERFKKNKTLKNENSFQRLMYA